MCRTWGTASPNKLLPVPKHGKHPDRASSPETSCCFICSCDAPGKNKRIISPNAATERNCHRRGQVAGCYSPSSAGPEGGTYV